MCKERGKVPHPGCERSWSLEIGNLLVEGHEAYHSAQSDEPRMMWLNSLVYCLVPRKSMAPMRRGSFPQGIPLG
jgi:hypothetical protein